LELSSEKEYYPDLLNLNTGRNCLEYLIRTGKFKKIYLPFYSSKVLLEPMEKLDVEYELTENLLPLPIDQRYSSNDLFGMVELLKSVLTSKS